MKTCYKTMNRFKKKKSKQAKKQSGKENGL